MSGTIHIVEARDSRGWRPLYAGDDAECAVGLRDYYAATLKTEVRVRDQKRRQR